jgi:hypothetical protein
MHCVSPHANKIFHISYLAAVRRVARGIVAEPRARKRTSGARQRGA